LWHFVRNESRYLEALLVSWASVSTCVFLSITCGDSCLPISFNAFNPLNNINAFWFLLLVQCAQTVLKLNNESRVTCYNIYSHKGYNATTSILPFLLWEVFLDSTWPIIYTGIWSILGTSIYTVTIWISFKRNVSSMIFCTEFHMDSCIDALWLTRRTSTVGLTLIICGGQRAKGWMTSASVSSKNVTSILANSGWW